MDVSEPRVSQLVTPLEGFGLAARLPAAGRSASALTDGGLAVLARRDRASVGVARRRWSVTPADPEGPARLAQRLRREKQAASQEHRAHRRRSTPS